MVRRSRKRSVRVTPRSASRALQALHYARQADNLQIEIAAARVLDAYCQGRLIAAEVVADADAFPSATGRTGQLKTAGAARKGEPSMGPDALHGGAI
jgi:hypothetical protein